MIMNTIVKVASHLIRQVIYLTVKVKVASDLIAGTVHMISLKVHTVWGKAGQFSHIGSLATMSVVLSGTIVAQHGEIIGSLGGPSITPSVCLPSLKGQHSLQSPYITRCTIHSLHSLHLP